MNPTSYTISVINQKGGSGKTMAVYGLSAGLAEQGYRVLVVDLDEQCPHAAQHQIVPKSELPPLAHAIKTGRLDQVILPSKHYEKLFVTVGDETIKESEIQKEVMRETLLKRALEPLKEYFDFIVIDTSQALDVVTLNAIMAADLLLIACDVDRETIRSTVKTIRATRTFLTHRPEVDPERFFRILISNYEQHRDATVNAWFYQQLAPYATYLMKAIIHRTTHLKKSRSACLPIFKYVKALDLKDHTALRAVEDFTSLTNEVVEIYEHHNQETTFQAGHGTAGTEA